MIVSVTALGARDGDAAGAATKVVKYLEGQGRADQGRHPAPSPDVPSVEAGDGVVGYYADSMAAPGIWMGHGMTGVRMEGLVDSEQLHRVLMGQNLHTGEQLVGASGSAQRAHGDALAAALEGPDHELLRLGEAAKALGVGGTYLRQRAAATDKVRAERARQELAGEELTPLPPSHLDATRDGARGHWRVSRAELRRFAEEREKPTVVLAYDITFSVPKSVSILWARANPAQQVAIEAAITDAVRAGVAYVEERGAQVQVSVANQSGKGHHMESQPATGLVAAAYLHDTSRALDPQLHFHVVVANMAEGPDAKVRTLDGRGVFCHAKTASHLAAAELRHRLALELGVSWTPVHRGLADVDGVPREAIVEMSQRARQIDEHIAAMPDELPDTPQPITARGRQIAAYDTRAPKDTPVDPDALRPSWSQRLDVVGFDHEAAQRCYGRQRSPELVSDAERHGLFNLMASPEGITELASTFDRRDVLKFVADWAGDRLSAAEIADVADEWLLIPEIVPLHASQRSARTGDVIRRADGRRVNALGPEALYTTRNMLVVEAAIDDGYRRGRDANLPTVPPATVEAVLAARGHLGEDQLEFVRAITASTARIQPAKGPAGSGKTTAMEAASRAWELEGYNVIGSAVQGTAAETVGDKAAVCHATVASILWRIGTNDPAINERSKILVDECSTLGNRDFNALIHAAERTGAQLILLGDPPQHDAVAAGGAWRRVVQVYADHVPALSEVRRQKGAEMADVRQALALWRSGDVAGAVRLLDRNERVVVASDRDELMAAVVGDWYADRLRRGHDPELEPSSMMTEHHRERRELNALARAHLVADGTLHGPVLRAGELEFQAGDEVMALEQDRELRPAGSKKRGDFVRTAECGVVVAVHLPQGRDPGSLVVDFTRRGLVQVPMEYLTRPLQGRGINGALAHTYALTTHAAQGDTYDAARALVDDATSAKSVYVAITRGVNDLRIYVMFRDELTPAPDVHPEMPRLVPETTALVALTNNVADGRDELLATEIDPLAPEVAALQWQSLAELDKTASSPTSMAATLAARALEQAEDAIARAARLHPDEDLLPRLGSRPEAPVDRRLWDDAVGQVAVYRARYNPTPVAGGAWVTWALGPVPDHPAQRAAYSAAGKAVNRADRAALARRSVGELAADRLALRRALAVYPGQEERHQANDQQTQARAARDQAGAARAEALAALEAAEHPRLRRPNPRRVEAARNHLGDADAMLNQAIDHYRVASDNVAALEPDAIKAAREPVEQRLERVNDAIADHVEEVVASPPPYLITALGPRRENPTQRPRWDDAARKLETWRQAELGLSPEDGPLGEDGLAAAIGGVPDNETQALRRQMAIRELPVEFTPAPTIELGIDGPGLTLD